MRAEIGDMPSEQRIPEPVRELARLHEMRAALGVRQSRGPLRHASLREDQRERPRTSAERDAGLSADRLADLLNQPGMSTPLCSAPGTTSGKASLSLDGVSVAKV